MLPGEPGLTILVLIQAIQWFGQLFLLPLFALVHFAAVFHPMFFRRLKIRHAVVALLLIGFVACKRKAERGLPGGLTAPLFTSCCGFVFYIPGYYWSFDYAKPFTPVYNQFNLVLQSVCVGIMVLLDVLIVFRVAFIRKASEKLLKKNDLRVSVVSRGPLLEEDKACQEKASGAQRRPSRTHRAAFRRKSVSHCPSSCCPCVLSSPPSSSTPSTSLFFPTSASFQLAFCLGRRREDLGVVCRLQQVDRLFSQRQADAPSHEGHHQGLQPLPRRALISQRSYGDYAY